MTAVKRRDFIRAGAVMAGSASALGHLLWSAEARAAIGDTLTIAYNVAPPSWDPNTGPSSVNPSLQSIYRTLYDTYIMQREDLSLAPGIFEEYSWNADKTSLALKVRQGVTWHDGKALTPEDVLWNLRRLTDPTLGAPLQPSFAGLKNFKIDGQLITCDVGNPWRATMLDRFAFLGCFLLAPHHFEKVGKEGFEKSPMGSGPYKFDQYERGSFLRLKANPNYWGGKPLFETVVFKIVTDPASRVAEIERGSSDATMDLLYQEYDRLRVKPGLKGVAAPTTDIALIYFSSIGVMTDANVRKAAVHAVDKKLIVDRLLRGYGKPVDTLSVPQEKVFDPTITTPYDPKLATELLARSGYSKDNPVSFTVQTTRGYRPMDYEIIQAIVEMWRRVGIKANIEVYEPAKHFELRTQHKLAPAAFYVWGNSMADPETSVASAMRSVSPHSSWKSADVDAIADPLFDERNDEKRIASYRKLNRYIADNAYLFPLFQLYQPVVYKAELTFKPHLAGFVMPTSFGRAS